MKLALKVMSVIGLLTIMGCTGLGPKPKVEVSLRKDVDTASSTILAFPILLVGKDGSIDKVKFSNPVGDSKVIASWKDQIPDGGQIIPVPREVLGNIPQAYDAIETIVRNFDAVSAIEQTTKLTKVLGEITTKVGDGAFAFALVFQNEEEYKSAKRLNLNMGLFDVKQLTWKWIVKTSIEAPAVPLPYEVVISNSVDAAFLNLKEEMEKK